MTPQKINGFRECYSLTNQSKISDILKSLFVDSVHGVINQYLPQSMFEDFEYRNDEPFESALAKAEENSSEFEQQYELPDGNSITLDTEKFRCPEVCSF